jgi:hypothetical protein
MRFTMADEKTCKLDWDCYPEHLRPSEPPDTERAPSMFQQELLGEFADEIDPDCPECAYEKETGKLSSMPHHCDQESEDEHPDEVDYYHHYFEEEDD